MRSTSYLFCVSTVIALFWADSAEAQKRVWTAKSGHQVIATLEDQTEDAISLRIANRRQPVVVSIQDLADEDQAFLQNQVEDDAEDKKIAAVLVGKPGDHARRLENPLFVNYLDRLDERRAIALESRRIYNANKGPAVYSLGQFPDPMFPMGVAIERGWVQQPVIVYPWYYRPWWHRPIPRIIVDDPFVHSFSD